MTKKKVEFLGLFDWAKIRDKRKRVEIDPFAFERVEEFMDPQDVQDYFDEYGIEEAVMRINREHLIRYGKYALELDRGEGFTILRCSQD